MVTSMHGVPETTHLPRTVWTVAHLVIVLAVGWLYFGGGIATVGDVFGQPWQAGDFGRRLVLMGFAITLWLRMSVTAYVLLKRRFDWPECGSVIGAVAFYQVGFAIFGATAAASLSAVDLLAVGLFALGSTFNTGAEVQRKRFKSDPAKQGQLYTQGLFALVRHPNYLGDILWALGWAVLTRNGWAIAIPAVAVAGFVFMFIPQLSAYLAERYGKQYEDWAGRTKRLIPYIY
jgi:protein-S-isoprenylcysteine O-methyltransferase Ste14